MRVSGRTFAAAGGVLAAVLITGYNSFGIWLIAPFLVMRGHAMGWFFAWTFFGAMGISELAHFVFPFLTGGGYEYHGGIVTAVVLAPAGWWGMWRMWHGRARASN